MFLLVFKIFYMWSNVFEHTQRTNLGQKYLTTFKIFLTWSINLWTIRWIRHSTVVNCWKEFLRYFITLETYRFKNPKLLHDFWSAPDSSHSVLDHCSSKYSHCTAAATVLPVLLYIPWTVFLVWNSHKESMRKFSYLLNHNGSKSILKEHSKKITQTIFYKNNFQKFFK